MCIVDNPPVIINTQNRNYNNDEQQSIITSNDNYYNSLKTNKRPLVRSKTENSVSSLNKTVVEKTNNLKISADKKRYTLEFLLSRSDLIQSQKMPDSWKILNQLYPDVCFNGKIISYFNPNKYFAHWNKVKLQNTELHSLHTTINNNSNTTTISTTTNNLPHSKSFHSNSRFMSSNQTTSSIPSSSSSTSSTDDYLNLKSNNFDNYFKQNAKFTLIDNNNTNTNKRNYNIHQNAQQKRFDINHKNSILFNSITNNKQFSKSINNNNANNNSINQTLFNNTAAHASSTNAFKYNDRKNFKFSNFKLA